MATAVLFISWSHPHHVTEPEKDYVWLATEGAAYLRKQEGTWFERMEQIALTAHGGGVHGCIILFGERAKLDELRRTDDFEAFAMALSRHFADAAVVPGLNWDGIQAVMKRRNMK